MLRSLVVTLHLYSKEIFRYPKSITDEKERGKRCNKSISARILSAYDS
ncbi:hypothetical protein MNB_SV-6-1727 [hydrothermal vent metagenome]|uniref:Uncharacterized protein n=1 Tax=hydrothermal vent metagenome TaxID=652676 RepID=A0A1W1BY14_9ZZZZ